MPRDLYERMVRLQRAIAEAALATLKPLPWEPRYAVGLDASYSRRYGGVSVAALIDIRERRLVSYSYAVGEPPIPYIPGLLAFREAPGFYAAYTQLEPPQQHVVVVDGHGLSHPRLAGIATHLGMALRVPTIGVAKRKLAGEEVAGGDGVTYVVVRGIRAAAIIEHRRARLYVSPGAYIDLESAMKLVRKLLDPHHRLPLPTYHADRLSRMIARQLDAGVIKPGDKPREPPWS